MLRRAVPLFFLLVGLTSCVRNQPQVIVITSTPASSDVGVNDIPANPTSDSVVFAPPPPSSDPTLDPTPPGNEAPAASEYVVQPGDTLSGIAAVNGVSLQSLLTANNITNPDILSVGEVIKLPEVPQKETSSFKIIPDS